MTMPGPVPRVTFLGGDGRYCGQPAVAACELCLRTHGGRVGGSLTVAALRRRSARWLGGARRVIVPTADTKRRLAQYFPASRGRHRAPGGVPAGLSGACSPAGGEATGAGPIRVALIGGIGVHKGYDVLLACAKDAARRQLPLEFTVVGHTEDDARLMATGKVFVTGRYEEEEIEALLRRERPHLAWFASAVPETWCYALSHAIRAGLPIFASDLGALGERLAGSALCYLGCPGHGACGPEPALPDGNRGSPSTKEGQAHRSSGARDAAGARVRKARAGTDNPREQG